MRWVWEDFFPSFETHLKPFFVRPEAQMSFTGGVDID